MNANVSQRAIAQLMGWSQADYWRFETLSRSITLPDIATVASVLGLELSASFHPLGDPIHDKGHQALGGRLRNILSPALRVVAEVRLPNPGDPRSWDLLLRLDDQLIGVELETRIRDIQRLVRHIRERERDGGVDIVLLVVADTRTNRGLRDQLLEALGPGFATPPREILHALRSGTRLPGSGVILL